MDEREFEKLLQRLLYAIGAVKVDIVNRLHDKGVDILGSFPLGPVTQVRVGVQAKYHRGETDKSAIDQLQDGLTKEDLSVGWLVTSGTFPKDSFEYLEQRVAGRGVQIDLIDGDQLAGMIVDAGLEKLVRSARG